MNDNTPSSQRGQGKNKSIRQTLSYIKSLAEKPDKSSDAYKIFLEFIDLTNMEVLSLLEKDIEEIVMKFLPKKRKNLKKAVRDKVWSDTAEQTSDVAASQIMETKKVPHSDELRLLEDISKIFEEKGSIDQAFDMLSDAIMVFDENVLITFHSVIQKMSVKFEPSLSNELKRLIRDRVGDLEGGGSIIDNDVINTEVSGGQGAVQEKEKSIEAVVEEVRNLIKRPDRTSEAFYKIKNIINTVEVRKLEDGTDLLESVLLLFKPRKRNELSDILSIRFQQSDFNIKDDSVSTVDITKRLREVNEYLQHPDKIMSAFEILQDTIKNASVSDVGKYDNELRRVCDLFFPKKRRDILRALNLKTMGEGAFLESEFHAEYISNARKLIRDKEGPEKIFAAISDVIMTFNPEVLEEYSPDLFELSAFLPKQKRQKIVLLINRTLSLDDDDQDEIVDEVQYRSEPYEAPQVKTSEPEIVQQVEHLDEVTPDIHHDKTQEKEAVDHDDPSSYIFSHHAQFRTGQRRIPYDAIEMALRYGRTSFIRGAKYYVIGRQEVENYKREDPAIKKYEGVHVLCATDDASIITVYKNKDFRGLKPKRRPGRRYRNK